MRVYPQVLEETAARWAAVGVAVSVHSLACHPLNAFGTDQSGGGCRRCWVAA